MKGASISGGQNDEDKGANEQYEVGPRQKKKRLEILKGCGEFLTLRERGSMGQ